MEKTLTIYVLVRKRTGEIVKEAGVSFNPKDIEPNPVYKDEYKMISTTINSPPLLTYQE